MINTSKAVTLESVFPLLAVEEDCMISKQGDITVGFKVSLPEIFTVGSSEYEMIHATWLKAIRVLPDYSIVHKQDWFIKEEYKPALSPDMSYFSRSFQMHFNERPFLNHTCYLFLTKTTKKQMRSQSSISCLTRGNIVPKSLLNLETKSRFLEAVGQVESILKESGFISLERLTQSELIKDDGVLQKHFSLQKPLVLKDIEIASGRMKIGDDELCLHTLSSLDDLPSSVKTESRYERLSTDRSDCMLSYASPVAILLGCNHMYNQYIFIEDHAATMKMLESRARNMFSLSRFSRANEINKLMIDDYINTSISFNLKSCYAHCNVMAWSSDPAELRNIKNDVGSQLAQMDCKPHYNTTDVPTLFMASVPGNAGDFPSEERYLTFPEQALCFFNEETNYQNSPSPFGIKLVDPLTAKPLHVDISDLPMEKGIITNRNKFILGPSGSGKSFFTNHIMRQYYEQGSHIILVDMGNSYQGLCNIINQQTHGKDGIYFTYTEKNPIAFNPFYTEDGIYDIEKKESIKTLILCLWKREGASVEQSESLTISKAINMYVEQIRQSHVQPSFNTFYEFFKGEFAETELKSVREKEFDLFNFLYVLKPFYKGGEFDYLLNSDNDLDLLSKRFIVFEIDSIKDNKVLFPVVTIVIMEAYINKLRRLKGIRKILLLEEAWKAIAKDGMAEYVKYLFKTVRKYFGEVIVVTQEVDDIISSPIVKESIIANSDCKILLDQRKYLNKFDVIQRLLGLTDKEAAQIHTLNKANDPARKYKQVWIGLNGQLSKVYDTEVSREENYAFTTEEKEKMELFDLVDTNNGNIELSIKQLTNKKRSN